jgi:hypothetical protein
MIVSTDFFESLLLKSKEYWNTSSRLSYRGENGKLKAGKEDKT